MKVIIFFTIFLCFLSNGLTQENEEEVSKEVEKSMVDSDQNSKDELKKLPSIKAGENNSSSDTIKEIKPNNRMEKAIGVEKPSAVNRGHVKASDSLKPSLIETISSGPDDFKFSYNTEDGHNREESIHVDRAGKSIEDENETAAVRAKGSYSFTSADGFEYTVNYVADGKGYRPQVTVKKA